MISTEKSSRKVFLLAAGAKGAIGSTLAVAAGAFCKAPQTLVPFLTTENGYPSLDPLSRLDFAGWDVSPYSLKESIVSHGVLSPDKWKTLEDYLDRVEIRPAPSNRASLPDQVEHLKKDIREFRRAYPESTPVFVNVLPACPLCDIGSADDLDQLYQKADPENFPDLAYALAAVTSGVPVVNFTPNGIELPAVIREAEKSGVPLCGRDGKTGQTYLKVVLASALKARNLRVDGWYSLNILGNQDGRNLADPRRAAGKLANKTEVLEEVLGYPVADQNGSPSHKVVIDYYPPRGDAKEAWDVIDFTGLFGLPMSLRINLLARDSILAAPLVIDLARWMSSLQAAGRRGLVPELGFYFKKPLGSNPPLSFQDQLFQLSQLGPFCRGKT